ncbi:MAG: hypothetical protein ACE5QF_02705 [Thermoplasmata archaeon]
MRGTSLSIAVCLVVGLFVVASAAPTVISGKKAPGELLKDALKQIFDD